MTRKIMLAADASDASTLCLNWYIQNFRQPGDWLYLVHVHTMPEVPAAGLLGGTIPLSTEYQTLINASVQRSKDILSLFKKRCDQFNIDCEEVLADDYHSPGHVLVRIAREKHVDVILTGSRGMGAVGRLFVGSTSDYLLHHANTPVIVIPNVDAKKHDKK